MALVRGTASPISNRGQDALGPGDAPRSREPAWGRRFASERGHLALGRRKAPFICAINAPWGNAYSLHVRAPAAGVEARVKPRQPISLA